MMRPLGKHAVAALAASVLALPLASLGAQAARPLPSAVDSLYQASRQYLARGDTAAALDALEAVERRAPRFAVAFFDHGVILSRRSEMGLALDDVLRRRRAGDKLERALDLDPNNPLYVLELGRLRL
ncbi:MAG: hypothetical protein ACYC1W_08415 [Gemmatimonadaceae bacterium]